MTEEANTIEAEKPDVALFFTSAEDNKPTYRRGILDALCYPVGHVLQYSYRLHNIHPDLRPQEGKARTTPTSGVIIFVDVEYPPSDKAPSGSSFSRVTYFPLRRVNIIRFPSLKPGQHLAERERASYFLELADFIEYKTSEQENQWHKKIAAFDSTRSFSGKNPQYFVIPGSDILASSTNTQTAWEDV